MDGIISLFQEEKKVLLQKIADLKRDADTKAEENEAELMVLLTNHANEKEELSAEVHELQSSLEDLSKFREEKVFLEKDHHRLIEAREKDLQEFQQKERDFQRKLQSVHAVEAKNASNFKRATDCHGSENAGSHRLNNKTYNQ